MNADFKITDELVYEFLRNSMGPLWEDVLAERWEQFKANKQPKRDWEILQSGKIYYISFGGTEIVGRYKSEDVCNYFFYDYLHQWAGYETFHGHAAYTVKHGITEMREATQTEKQALLRHSIQHNTI